MILHDGKHAPTLAYPQDPDSARPYTVLLRPDVWRPNAQYYDGESIIVPTQFRGYHYVATTTGISGDMEPDFSCGSGNTVQDGCVTWQASSYGFFLRPDEMIASAVWSSDTPGVTISGIVTPSNKSSAMISTIPPDAGEVRITVHLEIAGGGKKEDRSFIIPVAEL